MDEDEAVADVPTKWQGRPEALALLVVALAGAVLWRQIRDAFTWWWDTVNGMSDGVPYGELVVFALGLLVVLIAVGCVLAALAGLFRGFGNGWRRT